MPETAAKIGLAVYSAIRNLLPLALFGVAPIAFTIAALWVAHTDDLIALDFHNELYPQAKDVLDGTNPYPAADADLSSGANAIWPIAAVLPVVPLALLPPGVADWLFTAVELACLVGTLLILGVRDWRIYGATLLLPPVINAVQTGNATLPLAVLCAVAWRYRSSRLAPGLAVGAALAIKFFLWPLAIWLVAVRRPAAAALAAVLGLASLLLILPFESITNYVDLIRELTRTFDERSYTLYALLIDSGAPSELARAVWAVTGLGVLALSWHRRSFTLAIGAALLLSPIVWLHFFALLVVPLAIAYPRFSAAWLMPLPLWFVPGTYNGAAWQTALVLAVVALTLIVCEVRPRFLAVGEGQPTPDASAA
jgi:hypothetical protein